MRGRMNCDPRDRHRGDRLIHRREPDGGCLPTALKKERDAYLEAAIPSFFWVSWADIV